MDFFILLLILCMVLEADNLFSSLFCTNFRILELFYEMLTDVCAQFQESGSLFFNYKIVAPVSL